MHFWISEICDTYKLWEASWFLAFLTWCWIRDWFYYSIDWRSASLAFRWTRPVWFEGLASLSELMWLNGLEVAFVSFGLLPFDSSTWLAVKTDVGCRCSAVPPAWARAVLASATDGWGPFLSLPALTAARIDYVSCWTWRNCSRLVCVGAPLGFGPAGNSPFALCAAGPRPNVAWILLAASICSCILIGLALCGSYWPSTWFESEEFDPELFAGRLIFDWLIY